MIPVFMIPNKFYQPNSPRSKHDLSARSEMLAFYSKSSTAIALLSHGLNRKHLVLCANARAAAAPPLPLLATKTGVADILRACSHLNQVQQLHALLLTTGLSHKNALFTQLLLSLTISGEMDYARALFDAMHKPRVFLWNTLVRGYVRNGLCAKALDVYARMQRLGVRPDTFTFPFVLKACTELIDMPAGTAAHALLFKYGLLFDAITTTELMVMYASLGDAGSADCVFEGMGESRDLIAWNALISSYAQSGRADKALSLFRRMDSAGVEPDAITLVSALSSCAYLGCLEQGKHIHRCIRERLLDMNVFVDNALLDMYAKCGCMEEAARLFGEMRQRNVVSWSTMIGGYAINGHSQQALAFFSQMRGEDGIRPNNVTMLAVLLACSHAGLVREGKEFFNKIATPGLEHYATIVDLLGRSGHLEEAYALIRSMPVKPDAGVWGALLGACSVRRNTQLGQLAADELLKLSPETSSYQVLLSNIYAATGRWDRVEKVRRIMRRSNVRKVAAYSSVEFNGEVHVFYEGSHSDCKNIYEKLEELTGMVRSIGYIPEIGMALHDVDGEEKEVALRTHSEKLAVAFSLTRLGTGTPVRIMKNLRICSDCHTFSKLVSVAVGREIIMRDKNRFHHFKGGTCSCGDFW